MPTPQGLACRAASAAAGVCASPNPGYANNAWNVNFNNGNANNDNRDNNNGNNNNLVRLVR